MSKVIEVDYETWNKLKTSVASLQQMFNKQKETIDRLNEIIKGEKEDSWEFYNQMRHWKNKALVLESQENRRLNREYKNRWLDREEEPNKKEYNLMKR